MPNWTSNTLKVKGVKIDRDLFASQLKAFISHRVKNQVAKWTRENPSKCREQCEEYEKSITPLFDFNFVIPMPKEMENTTYPRPRTREEIISMAEHGNWTKETLEERLETALTSDEKKRLDELKSLYGCDNWYDWCCTNWGTKWNACHSEGFEIHESATMTIYNFDTAWSPPVPVIHALAVAYPKLRFRLEYTCEGESGRYAIIGDPDECKRCRKLFRKRWEDVNKILEGG
jgi:hypothetical protein